MDDVPVVGPVDLLGEVQREGLHVPRVAPCTGLRFGNPVASCTARVSRGVDIISLYPEGVLERLFERGHGYTVQMITQPFAPLPPLPARPAPGMQACPYGPPLPPFAPCELVLVPPAMSGLGAVTAPPAQPRPKALPEVMPPPPAPPPAANVELLPAVAVVGPPVPPAPPVPFCPTPPAPPASVAAVEPLPPPPRPPTPR